MQTSMDRATVDGIKFWSHQFAEHMEFMINSLRDESDEAPTDVMRELSDLQGVWERVSKDPSQYRESFLERTVKIQARVADMVASLECVPDLIHHMQEETDYFDQSVLRHEFRLRDEIVYWSHEHAENLDFVNCQLPKLILMQNLGPAPEWLTEMAKANDELSKQLKELASANETGVLDSIREAFGNESSEVSQEEYETFMALKTVHLQSLDELLKRVKDLPLAPGTQMDVYNMVRHERHEAIFAINRAKSYLLGV